MNENIIIRTAQWSDVQGVAKLVHAVDEAEGDAETSDSAEEIEHGWHAPGFNPETDAFVAETAQKEIVGYWEVFNSRHNWSWMVMFTRIIKTQMWVSG
jgi:hypothetical protein